MVSFGNGEDLLTKICLAYLNIRFLTKCELSWGWGFYQLYKPVQLYCLTQETDAEWVCPDVISSLNETVIILYIKLYQSKICNTEVK